MKKETQKHYEAPQVEVVEVEIEKGFATSTTGEQLNGFGGEENSLDREWIEY